MAVMTGYSFRNEWLLALTAEFSQIPEQLLPLEYLCQSQGTLWLSYSYHKSPNIMQWFDFLARELLRSSSYSQEIQWPYKGLDNLLHYPHISMPFFWYRKIYIWDKFNQWENAILIPKWHLDTRHSCPFLIFCVFFRGYVLLFC